jgi:putative FmdB family regulatory protein
VPIYEYECAKHGMFEASNSVQLCKQDMPCPDCSKSARRVLSAPHLALMDPATRTAHDRNHKSRHEPHVHGPNCGHHHGAPKKRAKTQVSKGRPWVLEHG